jgi:hypothetical protein
MEIHQSGSKAKLSKHLTPPSNPPLADNLFQTWVLAMYICGMIWTGSYIIALKMGTKTVPEMSMIFNQLTWLIAQECIIEENMSQTRKGNPSTYLLTYIMVV